MDLYTRLPPKLATAFCLLHCFPGVPKSIYIPLYPPPFMSCEYHLYYYSSPVRKNLSLQFDEFLPERSQFDSDHRVDFSTPTSCQSTTFVRPLFACPLFFTTKNHKQRHRCDESVSIGVIDQLRSVNDDPNALLQINRYMATQVPALIQPVDPRVAAQLVPTIEEALPVGHASPIQSWYC